jgi:hypothetical protein
MLQMAVFVFGHGRNKPALPMMRLHCHSNHRSGDHRQRYRRPQYRLRHFAACRVVADMILI